MNFLDLKQIVEDAGFDARSYSGRGMYGLKRLSFNLEREENEFDAILSIAESIKSYIESLSDEPEFEDVTAYFMGAKSDSMGLGTVVYFPNIEWEEVEEQFEEDFIEEDEE